MLTWQSMQEGDTLHREAKVVWRLQGKIINNKVRKSYYGVFREAMIKQLKDKKLNRKGINQLKIEKKRQWEQSK